MKLPRFLIAENPMAGEKHGHRVFVVHTGRPMILAEAYHFDPADKELIFECRRTFEVGAYVDYPGEAIILGAVRVEAIKWDGTAQELADELAGIMRRMGDWYHAYLKWEDRQIDNEDTV